MLALMKLMLALMSFNLIYFIPSGLLSLQSTYVIILNFECRWK